MENNLILQVGVKILLKNKDGQYLLLRRSLEKYPDIKGRWDIVGGRIDTGKTLIENLKREVFEETGLEIVGNPKLIAAQDILRETGRHVVRLTYLGKTLGEIKLDTNENDLYKWYSWEELTRLDDVDIYFKELLNDQSLWISKEI
ncbi:MAG: NUDIX hydrolase [Patescibacteria group bacterium]